MAGNPLQQMIPLVMQQLSQNPQMLQQIMQMVGGAGGQQGGMLMQLASSLIPKQPLAQGDDQRTPYEQMPHPNPFYNDYSPYSNDYGKGSIQEAAPPPWLDPQMELIERERAYTPPGARKLMPLPSDPIDTMNEDREPIDPEDLPEPIEQES